MIEQTDTFEKQELWWNGESCASSDFWLPLQQWYLPCKSALDFVIALGLLILTSPVLLLAALLVKLTSSGPAFYAQTRVSQNGRPYRIWKLRTMYHNCEQWSGPRWASRGDPRITPLGHYLRRLHVDELPQLWNVICGDMCLVGPRPERPEFVPSLEKALPNYTDRLLVRPGITGLAQVQLPPDTDLTSVRRKLAYDLYYVRHLSPWLDLRILLCTLLYLLRLPVHWLPRFRLIPKPETVEQTYQEGTCQVSIVPSVQPA